MRRGKEESLAQTLQHPQCSHSLPVSETCRVRSKQIQDGAYSDRVGQEHFPTKSLRQFTGGHLREDVADEEAAEQPRLDLLVPFVLLKVGIRAQAIGHGDHGHR